MSELFKKDMKTKIFSLAFAVILWFFVLDSLNPVVSHDLSVPLKIENEESLKEKGFVIANENFPRNVSISLKGRKDKISTLGINDVEAKIDFEKINDVNTQNLHVEVDIHKEGFSVESITPRLVNIELEQVGKNSFPVEVITVGEPKENYRIIEVASIPGMVSIEATDSVINSIGEVKVYVDVSNIVSELIVQKECVIYDHNSEVLEDIDVELNVNVKVEMAKEVPIVPVIKGRPARNFIDGVHEIVPDKALITGAPDVVEWIDNIRTEEVSIENMNQSETKRVSLNIPEGVRLVETPSNVYVDLVIEEKAARELTIRSQDVAIENAVIDDSFIYDIVRDDIDIVLEGREEELERISVESLKPSIDVEGLDEGSYRRPLKVELPRMVELLNDYELEVVIEEKEDMDDE
ncbi:CdaR family protein [Herbivorax sp. ANBcel31]|uniref:CdaR family protein n=1 Tax=Herbivorax sp. ANBcel31 TaxID=3069754 RepID=UPI0027B63DD6|nr:CdaR family protein [Herbivorax sp. ANBcel31]MDQ2087347.1 CdaR family protein [Herbivorax sp. ANBcel31]